MRKIDGNKSSWMPCKMNPPAMTPGPEQHTCTDPPSAMHGCHLPKVVVLKSPGSGAQIG